MEDWIKNLGIVLAVVASLGTGFMNIISRDEAMASDLNKIKIEKAVDSVKNQKDIEMLKSDMADVKDNMSNMDRRITGIESTMNSINYKIDIMIDAQNKVKQVEKQMERMGG